MGRIVFAAALFTRIALLPLLGIGLLGGFIIRLIIWSFSPWWFWPLCVVALTVLNSVSKLGILATEDRDKIVESH